MGEEAVKPQMQQMMNSAEDSAMTAGEQEAVPRESLRWQLAFWLGLAGNALSYVAIAIIIALPFLIVFDVFMRTIRHPTIWGFEVTVYALTAGGFLANAWALKTGNHFRVVTLITIFPRAKKWLDPIAYLMTLLFSLLIIVAGSMFVKFTYINDIHSASLFYVPLCWPSAFIPLGGIGLCLQSLAILLTGKYPVAHEVV